MRRRCDRVPDEVYSRPERLPEVVGWYEPRQSAGFIAATLGAILVLIVYHLFRRSSAKVA